MIDITHKVSTLRKAIAAATVNVSLPATLTAIQNNTVPKGNVLESARVAALFAVKRTADMIPDCHPMPVEFTAVRFKIADQNIHIEVEVHTVYKTGVEVEAMHGASVAALTIYDMLKPIDKGIEIQNIRLVEKKGGKSDHQNEGENNYTAAVVVCSDTVAAGKKQDKAGKAILTRLEKYHIQQVAYEIIPDEVTTIQTLVKKLLENKPNFILLTGGTGLSPRDVTPEAIKPLLTREVPGIMEAARSYGQQRTPYAMLSRGIAGFINQTLVLTLPGSSRGAEESMDALFPYLLHIFAVAQGKPHKEKENREV